MGQHQVYIDNV